MVTTVQHIVEKLQLQNLSEDQFPEELDTNEKIRHHSEPGRISTKFQEKKLRLSNLCDNTEEYTGAGIAGHGTHFYLETPPLCIHGNSTTPCHLCLKGNINPPAPPTKRHCRSLSIPSDLTERTSWQPQGLLWKPIALRPHHHNNNKQLKNRYSPLSHGKGSTNSLPGCGFSSIPLGRNLATASSDYFSTPPDSPVPRPASVSSGYYDSSLNSFTAPWLEQSTNSPVRNRYDAFNTRSLSMEDQISEKSTSAMTGGSMPVMPGCIMSTPSSPRRQRIPRCRSQPCVLHERDRKCGVKRRRDEDRPALNFNKMTESALQWKGIAIPKPHKPIRSLIGIFAEQVCGLKTIASSPLDSNFPPTVSFSPPLKSSLNEKEFVNENDEDDDGPLNTARSDSGCCISEEEPQDMLDFKSCSCHDDGTDQSSSHHHEDNDLMFPLETSMEIDLELIEND